MRDLDREDEVQKTCDAMILDTPVLVKKWTTRGSEQEHNWEYH